MIKMIKTKHECPTNKRKRHFSNSSTNLINKEKKVK